MRILTAVVAAIAVAVPAACAHAVSVLQIDVNSLTVDAGGAFGGTTHTGTLAMTIDASSVLEAIKINGADAGFAGTLTNFVGSIELLNGAVVGGSLFLEVDGVDTYSALISSAEGKVNSMAGQGFMIDGLTFSGFFSGSSFGGVDVTTWFAGQPLTGSFLSFAFSPNTRGVDSDADIDIFVMIPLPGAAGLSAAGLFALAGVRRRRMTV